MRGIDFKTLTNHEGFPVVVMGLLMMAFSIWGLLGSPSRNPFRLIEAYRMADIYQQKGFVYCAIILSPIITLTGIAFILGFSPHLKSVFEQPPPDTSSNAVPHTVEP